ncbi:hypothetical protein [Microbacterium terricola]|uniref:Uncharacterized protein n=1 Tax=Microbacterium terricola TaxID=344163 RepID=A0ABM8DVK7_9MICO|nr:hypothetical protein [Microbacterium terricola]UYK39557.1 hypothetical protein OAU46_12745 [Microbacterium terricola]BDV29708.1 hypothetical protein Microterr_03680 [Microbacterium terricola]
MTATRIRIPYDPATWIPVPLDYLGTDWADAGEWASWVAAEASRGRPGEAELAAAIEEHARSIALFPAEHVGARFWHYPADGVPTGFADAYVEARADDGIDPAELLPELGFTVVEPVIEPAHADAFDRAVRRLTLSAVLPDEDAEPTLLPKAEWLGIRDGWVGYLVSVDHDANALSSRLADLDELFRTLDPERIS